MLEEELLDIEINSEDERDIIENRPPARPKRGRGGQARCGCGNVYSCSSALSLHIKNKHGGQVPEGSIGFPSANYRRRDSRPAAQSLASTSSQQTASPANSEEQRMESQPHPIQASGQQESSFERNQASSIAQFGLQEQGECSPDLELGDELQSRLASGLEGSNGEWVEGGCRPRGKGKGGRRQYVSKRIYLCGCCSGSFGFLEELMLHIRQAHSGQIPDGSIFGLKREPLLRFFRLAAPPPAPPRRLYLFSCACGREYSCSSSLYYHIKTAHAGSEPAPPIG